MKRIFVDFSLVSHRTKVTGIPRVTYKYFSKFLEISLHRGGDWIVHPVYVDGGGVLRDCLHNLSPAFIGSYMGYLEKLAELNPDSEAASLLNILDLQINAGKNSVALSGKSPLANVAQNAKKGSMVRRMTQAKRIFLASIAGIDHKLINQTIADSRIPRSKKADLPHVSHNSFRTERKDVIYTPKVGDIVFMPAYWHDIAPMSYFTLQQSGMLIIPMLHDLLPVIIPDKYEQNWSRHFHFNVYITCLLADAVVSISHATSNDLGRLMEAHSFPPPKIFVQHHGFDFQPNRTAPTAAERFPATSKYFLMVGSIEPKKNHILVIDQFLEVSRKHPGVRLKIIGFPGWMHDQITGKIAQVIEQGLPVDHYQDVGDLELGIAYKNALATIMASSHEGFGLPIIESLSLGCPIILSDIPVFREIAGDHGRYFSLESPPTLAKVMGQTILEGVPSRPADFRWPDWDTQALVLFEWMISQQRCSRPVYNNLH